MIFTYKGHKVDIGVTRLFDYAIWIDGGYRGYKPTHGQACDYAKALIDAQEAK